MSIAALKAGKHVMCTVPMAISVDECRQIVELVRATGLKYIRAHQRHQHTIRTFDEIWIPSESGSA